jgi:hypothetical protein
MTRRKTYSIFTICRRHPHWFALLTWARAA